MSIVVGVAAWPSEELFSCPHHSSKKSKASSTRIPPQRLASATRETNTSHVKVGTAKGERTSNSKSQCGAPSFHYREIFEYQRRCGYIRGRLKPAPAIPSKQTGHRTTFNRVVRAHGSTDVLNKDASPITQQLEEAYGGVRAMGLSLSSGIITPEEQYPKTEHTYRRSRSRLMFAEKVPVPGRGVQPEDGGRGDARAQNS